MGLLDIFKKKKSSTEQTKHTQSLSFGYSNSASSNLFSKEELEEFIGILAQISYLFRDSKLLQGGRNKSMQQKIHSYAGILGYYYEYEYHYGKVAELVEQDMLVGCVLACSSMSNADNRKMIIRDLSDNWSDILQVIFMMKLEPDPNPDGDKLRQMDPEIQKLTLAFEKMSGKKCKEPKDPRKTPPRKVSYNPLNITEDLALSRGHSIPDITHIFAQDLFPQLASLHSGEDAREVVAGYTISMIKSYYDNAGFVPMVIVDQITGQINQVADMAMEISYSPYPSLKEYVLSRIYK